MTQITGPILYARPHGDYLAVSHPCSELRIGVIGADEEDARRLFQTAADRWAELLEAAKRRDAGQ
jgi:hypothetical protein